MPTAPAPGHTDLWGKTYGDNGDRPYPLMGHLLDTAAAARVVCDLMIPQPMQEALGEMAGSFNDWRAETELVAGWHDLGKASCGFQQKAGSVCPPWLADVGATGRRPPEGVKDHAWWSYLLLWDHLSCHGRATRERVAALAGGHHGVIPAHDRQTLARRQGRVIVDGPEPGIWGEELSRFRAEITETVSEVTGRRLADNDGTVATAAMSLAVVVLSDWLVSRSGFVSDQAESLQANGHGADWNAHHERAIEIAASDLREIGLVHPKPRAVTAEALVPSGKRPTSLQNSISAAEWEPYGITVITAPTGDGKTEAALLAAAGYNTARGAGGWYFAMPTTGTADGLLGRLTNAMGISADDAVQRLRLLHGLSRLREPVKEYESQSTDPDARDWMTGKKGMLAPFGVGTVDQLLMGVLSVKHSPLRMFGAATRTVIVDEAHCFDPYMRVLLRQAVEYLGSMRAPVVVMSATLPSERADELVRAYMSGCGAQEDTLPQTPYPGWVKWGPEAGFSSSDDNDQPVLPSRQWTLHVQQQEALAEAFDDAIADAAVEASNPSGCVLLVRESVRSAQETYEAVSRKADSGVHVVLLHSRFRHRDRKQRSDDLTQMLGPNGDRPDRMILVATQIVEMSLDVDFDVLITDPAPVGAILQRAGRIHRHPGRSRPAAHQSQTVQVWWKIGSNDKRLEGSRVYQRHDIQQTLKTLTAHPRIQVPSDVPTVVNEAEDFNPVADTEASEQAAHVRKQNQAAWDEHKARQRRVPAPRKRAAVSNLVRLTSPSESESTGTRLGHPTVQVLPVCETDRGYEFHNSEGHMIPLPARPGRSEESELFAACVPVVNYKHNFDSEHSSRATAWLDDLKTPEDHYGKTSRRSAWHTGPLRQVRLLQVDTDTTSHIGEHTVKITADQGLTYQKD